MFKVSNIKTGTMTWTIVSIVDFEQVNISWVK